MKIIEFITIFQKLKTAFCLKSVWSLSLILFMGSCQNVNKPEIPDDLIPEGKMVNILTDVYISNASRNVNHKLLKKRNLELDSIIYNKYEVDSLQFVVSNAYYCSDLDVYENLLTQVKDRLEILQKEKDSIYKIVSKQDSIEKSKKNIPKSKNIDKAKIISNTLVNPVQSN